MMKIGVADSDEEETFTKEQQENTSTYHCG